MVRPELSEGGYDFPEAVLPFVDGAGNGVTSGVGLVVPFKEELLAKVVVYVGIECRPNRRTLRRCR